MEEASALGFSPLPNSLNTDSQIRFIDFHVFGMALALLFGTRNTRGHPGAPSQPDTKNNKQQHFLELFWAPGLMTFLVFPGLAFACLSSVAGDVQMSSKCLENGGRNYTF